MFQKFKAMTKAVKIMLEKYNLRIIKIYLNFKSSLKFKFEFLKDLS